MRYIFTRELSTFRVLVLIVWYKKLNVIVQHALLRGLEMECVGCYACHALAGMQLHDLLLGRCESALDTCPLRLRSRLLL